LDTLRIVLENDGDVIEGRGRERRKKKEERRKRKFIENEYE